MAVGMINGTSAFGPRADSRLGSEENKASRTIDAVTKIASPAPRPPRVHHAHFGQNTHSQGGTLR
jgi:hypothetical protein